MARTPAPRIGHGIAGKVGANVGSGVPKPISAYTTDHGSGKVEETTPRDAGGMSTGETSGNFDPSGMTSIGMNPKGVSATPGADKSKELQQANEQ